MTDKSVAHRIEALEVACDLMSPSDMANELAAIRAEVEAVARELRRPPYDAQQEVWADRLSREP